MGIHSTHEVMAQQETAEEYFSFLNQMPPLFDDDDDFSMYSGLDCQFDLALQETWSSLPNFMDSFSDNLLYSNTDLFLPDMFDHFQDDIWYGFGNGFPDLDLETSWFDLFDSFCNGKNGHGGEECVGKKAVIDESCKTEKVIFRTPSKASNLSREAISEYFNLPINQAAKELNVGLTRLKKRCRELGIPRWPHRKLASLQTLINNVQEMTEEDEGGGRLAGKKRDAIEILEKEKKLMEEVPDKEMEGNIRRLRQSCFKAKYNKKRKLMMTCQYSSSPPSTITNTNWYSESNCDPQKEEAEDTMAQLCC